MELEELPAAAGMLQAREELLISRRGFHRRCGEHKPKRGVARSLRQSGGWLARRDGVAHRTVCATSVCLTQGAAAAAQGLPLKTVSKKKSNSRTTSLTVVTQWPARARVRAQAQSSTALIRPAAQGGRRGKALTGPQREATRACARGLAHTYAACLAANTRVRKI